MNIIDYIKDKVDHALAIPTMISGSKFAVDLFLASQDGVITDQEFHKLMSGADFVEFVILCGLTLLMRYVRKQKNAK